MSYLAAPRDEELQLLTQLFRATGPIQVTHSATLTILDRLEVRAEACFWADYDHRIWADITARGRKTLSRPARA